MSVFDDDFVEVYSKTTGEKQMVPKVWLGQPVGADFEVTPTGREEQRLVAGPSLEWTLKELQDHADSLGIDHTGLRSKKAVLDAIEAHTPEPPTDSTGVTEPPSGDPDGTPPNTETPANGAENKE